MQCYHHHFQYYLNYRIIIMVYPYKLSKYLPTDSTIPPKSAVLEAVHTLQLIYLVYQNLRHVKHPNVLALERSWDGTLVYRMNIGRAQPWYHYYTNCAQFLVFNIQNIDITSFENPHNLHILILSFYTGNLIMKFKWNRDF